MRWKSKCAVQGYFEALHSSCLGQLAAKGHVATWTTWDLVIWTAGHQNRLVTWTSGYLDECRESIK